MDSVFLQANIMGMVLTAWVRRYLYTDNDPNRPNESPVSVGEQTFSIPELWPKLNGSVQTTDVLIRLPTRVALASNLALECLAERMVRHHRLITELTQKLGPQGNWSEYCYWFGRMPDGEDRNFLITILRDVALIDMLCLLSLRLTAQGVEASSQIFARLAALATAKQDRFPGFLRDWGQMLDVYYGSEPGSSLARIEGAFAVLGLSAT